MDDAEQPLIAVETVSKDVPTPVEAYFQAEAEAERIRDTRRLTGKKVPQIEHIVASLRRGESHTAASYLQEKRKAPQERLDESRQRSEATDGTYPDDGRYRELTAQVLDATKELNTLDVQQYPH